MNPITYAIKKRLYKYQEKKFNKNLLQLEKNFQLQYSKEHELNCNTTVCTFQTGFQRHYTRYYTSTIHPDFDYQIIEDHEKADAIAFINTIDPTIIRPDQKIILFFHEPKDYAHLYQSVISSDYAPNNKIQVISHLHSPKEFISDVSNIDFHRSIPFVHFHHGATSEQLSSIDGITREGLICSITSGFSGIPGYAARRQFINNMATISSEFHLYGRFSKEAASLQPYVGPCGFKWETLKNYKYNLVIENSDDEYYISEKIFDALICGCMPIYYGSDKIFKIIPQNWFHYLPSLDSTQLPFIEKILKTDSYKIVSENRREIAEEIYSKFSFYSALKKIIKKQPLSVIA